MYIIQCSKEDCKVYDKVVLKFDDFPVTSVPQLGEWDRVISRMDACIKE